MRKIVRVISSFLCLATLLTVALSSDFVLNAENTITYNTKVSELVNQDDVTPSGFDTSIDPYDIMGDGKQTTIYSNQRIFLSENNRNFIKFRTGVRLQKDKISTNTFNLQYVPTVYEEQIYNEKWHHNNTLYTQCVSFDSDGDGDRESVAYLGLRDGHNVLWYYNTETNFIENEVVVETAWDGVDDIDYVYRAQSFFDITAGDFDGDYIDTVLVAIQGECNNHNRPVIYEYKLVNKEFQRINTDYSKYLNQAYLNNSIVNSDDYEDLLSIKMATGDFNGDNIDDLAVISYTNDISNKYDEEYSDRLYAPNIAIGLGSKSGLPSAPTDSAAVSNGNQVEIPISSDIACGDVNGDGVDEVVIGGYYGNMSWSDGWYINDSRTTEERSICVIYNVTNQNTLNKYLWKVVESNKWCDIWNNEYAWQTVGVATAYLNGKANPESIFLDGAVYSLITEPSGVNLHKDYSPGYFDSKDRASGGVIINTTFISEVVSGNFLGSETDREQFAFLVALKRDSYNEYYYIPGIIGKDDTDTADESDGFYSNDIENTQRYYGGSQNKSHIAAVESAEDQLTIRYNSKSFVWADPNVIAVLQAAPYFGDLGSYGDFDNGATSLSISSAYEYENGTSRSKNVGAGLTLDFDAKKLRFHVGFEGGYSHTWEKEESFSQETELSVSFTAGAYDTVILERTPIFKYSYDVWTKDENGVEKWIPNGYNCAVTNSPRYYQFSISEYNAFVEYYNNLIAENKEDFEKYNINTTTAYKKIDTDTVYDQEGNPYGYLNNSSADRVIPLGYNGGSSAMGFSESSSHSLTTSEEHEAHFKLSASKTFGNEEFLEVSIGAFIEGGFTWGSSKTVTTTSGTETSGEVCNFNVDEMASDMGISSEILRNYSFDWLFTTWNLDLGGFGTVPVYGYRLSNLITPLGKIEDLRMTRDQEANFIFTWSQPEDIPNLECIGYNIYISANDEDYTLLNDTLLTSATYSIPKDGLSFDTVYHFRVTSVALRRGNGKYLESVPSEDVMYAGGKEGLSAYDLAVLEGYNGTLSEWLASLIGENGKSAYELSVEDGFVGTLEDWLESLKGKEGVGIVSFEKAETENNTSKYVITMSDGRKFMFFVNNGTDGINGLKGKDGENGSSGLSAYQIALKHGFVGTEEEWLDSLSGGCTGEHSYNELVSVKTSCTTREYTLKHCTTCGKYSFEYDVEPTGHGDTTWITINSASELKGLYCPKCKTVIEYDVPEKTDNVKFAMMASVFSEDTIMISIIGFVVLVGSFGIAVYLKKRKTTNQNPVDN